MKLKKEQSEAAQNLADMLFDVLDRNGDGEVSKEELAAHMLLARYEEDSVDALFDLIDADGNGMMSRNELRTFLSADKTPVTKRRFLMWPSPLLLTAIAFPRSSLLPRVHHRAGTSTSPRGCWTAPNAGSSATTPTGPGPSSSTS